MKLVGILNITPDSASDGGLYVEKDKIIQRVSELISHGVSIVDVGAESTNQYSSPVSLEVEKSRLAPIFKHIVSIAKDSGVQVSIDTCKPEIASMCLDEGCDIVNDVRGLRDPRMLKLINDRGAYVIASHSVSVPSRFEITIPRHLSAVGIICDWMESIANKLKYKEKVIFDPGIGFGKTVGQDWEIVRNAKRLVNKSHSLGMKLCMGHSRKSLMQQLDRECGTLALSALFDREGVDFVRVHSTLSHSLLFNKLQA